MAKKHSDLEAIVDKLETEVRAKTESLRKEKEELNQKRNPLITKAQELKTEISSL